MKSYVLLENLRSAHNVGSIFRSADGAGVTGVFLIGCTPAPVDRFGRVQPEIQKTSLGAADTVPWEQTASVSECIQKLRSEGVQIIVVEQDRRAVPFHAFKPSERRAYIFGNEVDGVSKEAREEADEIIHIPMHGSKESLNVAVSAGIILFH